MTRKFVVLVVEAPVVEHMATHLTETDCAIAQAQGTDLLENLIFLELTRRRVTGDVWVTDEEEAGDEADAAVLEYADAVRAGKVTITRQTIRVDREPDAVPPGSPRPPFTRGH